MEKITFHPLVEHLKEHADEYNQLYYQYQLRSGKMDPVLLSRWIVSVIEPIVVSVTDVCPESLPGVFKAFYASLLPLLASNLALIYEVEYHDAWSMCTLNPRLISKQPKRIINAVNSALISLRRNQPEKVGDWIRSMARIVVYCRTADEFLNCGRIIAWLCGMAHLREKAIKVYPGLSEEIKDVLKTEKLPAPLDDLLVTIWGKAEGFKFQGVAGGFQGFGKAFTRAPLVAEVDGLIVASDRRTCCALFADVLGTVLIRDVPVAPERIIALASASHAKQLTENDRKDYFDFKDITSCVALDSSIVVTRSSSHYLFIYSHPKLD